MNILNFETEIKSKILKRGRTCYENGVIDELWNPKLNQYCAVVDGNEPCELEITLDGDGKIIDHACDCPCDWGEYCKHEVAVLLAIREHRKGGTTLPNQRQKKKRSLAARLEEYSKGDLIELFIHLSREYGLYQDIQYYFEEEEWDE